MAGRPYYSEALPAVDEAIKLYQQDDKLAEHVQHNHFLWRCVHGGLSLVRQSPIDIDPLESYWFSTEMRLLVAFFDKRFHNRHLPVEAVRSLTFKVFRHFQQARAEGRFGKVGLADNEPGIWPDLSGEIVAVAKELPDFEEYALVRKIYGSRRFPEEAMRDALAAFIRDVEQLDSIRDVERSFFLRLEWFPYLGLERLDQLIDRQRFWFGYYQLMASTNSYGHGGGMSLAPVLQNNRTSDVIAYVERWAAGETPHDTTFVVEGSREERDMRNHSCIVELYGFLNLHSVPFNNSRVESYYKLYDRPGDNSIFDRLSRIGKETRQFVDEGRVDASMLANEFRALAKNPSRSPQIDMETIGPASIVKKYPEEQSKRATLRFIGEMEEAARQIANDLSDAEAAVAMIHLIVDGAVYARGKGEPGGGDEKIGTPPPPQWPGEKELELPPSLQGVANDALGYLRAGHHVLFAGPPGTGKTTLAQLVGYAWNKDLETVPSEIDLAAAPPTTVGNSAWSPFHTIGGILPNEKGTFDCVPGVFIDPAVSHKDGEWQLLPGCIVLDEMNRADLDRCIGELYPLLSQSVQHVHPAGIPGVKKITLSPRFRIIATVNDATLDDIVFPISEGLARRFVRLELNGATLEALDGFIVATDEDAKKRRKALWPVLDVLREVCESDNRLTDTDLGQHLPFGVGYFSTLRDWVSGKLKLSTEFTDKELEVQARELLVTSLASVVRSRDLGTIVEHLRKAEDEV